MTTVFGRKNALIVLSLLLAAACGRARSFGIRIPPPDATAASPDGPRGAQDGPAASMDGTGAPPDRAPPAVICPYPAARLPVRPLRISPALAAERLNRLLAEPGLGGDIVPGAWMTTEHVEAAVRLWFGSTGREHLLPHAFFVGRTLSERWLPGAPVHFVLNALASGKGGLERLLAAPLDGPPPMRFGVFSSQELLALHKRAPARGSLLRNTLTCQLVPPPPPNTLSAPPRLPNETYRQSMERVVFSNAPACAACHRLITLLGFAFEHFDESGQFRETDNGQPINTSGTLVNVDGRDTPFDGPRSLMETLAASCAVRACVARQWLEVALRQIGREEARESAGRELAGALLASGDDLLELVIAIATSDAFLAP